GLSQDLSVALQLGKRFMETLANARQQNVQELSQKVNDFFDGEEGAMPYFKLRLSQAMQYCSRYYRTIESRSPQSHFLNMALQFQIPVCEVKTDLTSTKDLESDYIFGQELETLVDPSELHNDFQNGGFFKLFEVAARHRTNFDVLGAFVRIFSTIF